MKNLLLGILLSAHLFIVLSAPLADKRDGCAEGEPLVGESQPDVNMTAPKNLSIPEFSPLVIFCNADVARYPNESHTGPLQPPTRIIIHIGSEEVKECENGGLPVNECFYYLGSFFPALSRTISCTAVNDLGECRFKTSEIQLLSASTDSLQQSNMTTMTPNVTTASPGNVTTSAPPPPTVASTTEQITPPLPTTAPTPTPTTDDDDDDDDDDDTDSDDNSDDNSDDDSDTDTDDDDD